MAENGLSSNLWKTGVFVCMSHARGSLAKCEKILLLRIVKNGGITLSDQTIGFSIKLVKNDASDAFSGRSSTRRFSHPLFIPTVIKSVLSTLYEPRTSFPLIVIEISVH